MDTLILVVLAFVAMALVGALAVTFGADSRDAFRDPNLRPSRGAPTDVA
jgi:hypothetical protein